MPSVCRVLVSSNSLRTNWSSQGECRREPRTCPQWPRQEVSIVCPHREFEGLQRDAVDQVLQAVKFTNKNASGLSLALDEGFQAANCFTELIRGYTIGAVEPYIMMGLQPTGPTRVNLEVIVPSPGFTPAMWKQTATLCPLDWPSNYSLLRLWHTTKSFCEKSSYV